MVLHFEESMLLIPHLPDITMIQELDMSLDPFKGIALNKNKKYDKFL